MACAVKGCSLYFTGRNTVELRDEETVRVDKGHVLIKSLISAVSTGTELLVYRGQLPPGLETDTCIAGLRQPACYPMKYGYAVLGTVVEQDSCVLGRWVGKTVFVLYPHQSFIVAVPEELVLVPSDISPEDAVFLAFMDTAVAIVMDARPMIGESAVVLGQGVIGILTAGILASFPLEHLVAVERQALRRAASSLVGVPYVWEQVPDNYADHFPSGVDFVVELTGDPHLLDVALLLTGYAGRIIVGSWYGTRRASSDLGGRFHRDRITLQSSQVSTIAPGLLGRWTRERRYAAAWDMISRLRPSRLITLRRLFRDAQEVYALLDQHPEHDLQAVFMYD